MYTRASRVATAAEKLEQELAGRQKQVDISEDQADLLVTHPLLEGLVDSGGKHKYVIRNPYKRGKDFAADLASALEWPDLEHVIIRQVTPVHCHNGRLFFKYVENILDFIKMRRLIMDNDLEDLLR